MAIRDGQPAVDKERFVDARAEAYWNLRDLMEGHRDRLDPFDDRLAGQLGAIKWKLDSKGRVRIESKEEMRKRGVPSPDRADGVMMVFATERRSPDIDVEAHRGESITGDLMDEGLVDHEIRWRVREDHQYRRPIVSNQSPILRFGITCDGKRSSTGACALGWRSQSCSSSTRASARCGTSACMSPVNGTWLPGARSGQRGIARASSSPATPGLWASSSPSPLLIGKVRSQRTCSSYRLRLMRTRRPSACSSSARAPTRPPGRGRTPRARRSSGASRSPPMPGRVVSLRSSIHWSPAR